jgi:hypothetical protein
MRYVLWDYRGPDGCVPYTLSNTIIIVMIMSCERENVCAYIHNIMYDKYIHVVSLFIAIWKRVIGVLCEYIRTYNICVVCA